MNTSDGFGMLLGGVDDLILINASDIFCPTVLGGFFSLNKNRQSKIFYFDENKTERKKNRKSP